LVGMQRRNVASGGAAKRPSSSKGETPWSMVQESEVFLVVIHRRNGGGVRGNALIWTVSPRWGWRFSVTLFCTLRSLGVRERCHLVCRGETLPRPPEAAP
jgi:hypothetical protein